MFCTISFDFLNDEELINCNYHYTILYLILYYLLLLYIGIIKTARARDIIISRYRMRYSLKHFIWHKYFVYY